MTNKYGPRIITDGLVLALDAADRNSYNPNFTNRLYNLTQNEYITLYNGAGYNDLNYGTILFDGSNDYGSIALANDFTANNFTAMAFVKNTNPDGVASGHDTILSTANFRFQVQQADSFTTTNSFTQFRNTAGTTTTISNSLTNIPHNTWALHAIVVSSSTARLFYSPYSLNNWAATGSYPGTKSSNTLQVGYDSLTGIGGADPWYGNIGPIHIYNRDLSIEEIRNNYFAIKTRYNL